MSIQKLFGVEGAKQAHGTTVVIDIFRAASVSAYLLGKGASRILPVSTKEEAFAYKKNDPEALLVGEVLGLKIDEFNYCNSPFEISNADNIEGKTVVHRSSMGTQGLVNAGNASEIIFGSFVTCNAVAYYLTTKKDQEISIIAMDGEGSEDDAYADYLIARVQKKKTQDFKEITVQLRKQPMAVKFLDPNDKEFPEEDFMLCLDLDRFNFVPLMQDGFIVKHINE